jgi:pimeloyl-ACP methyl ester carboxylesterase
MPGRSYLHRYGDHPEQVADLVLPDGADRDTPQRCVVLVHGGLWREHFRRDLMAPLADDLADRGIASWNVEYRRLDCGGGWPATVDDVRASVEHLRRVGHEPLAAVGHSAGGQLALLLDGQVPAIVGQAAITDIELGIELRLGDDGTVVGRFAGGAPLDELSPIRRAPLGVPVLLVHGTADVTCPPCSPSASPHAAAT